MKTGRKYFLLFLLIILFSNCQEKGERPASGNLEISFTFDKPENIEPSYQIAIWLENDRAIHTLFISEYLSYGGYNDSTICPEWSSKVNWDTVADEVFDAVTRVTPSIGTHILSFDCYERGIFPGQYRYCAQVHVQAKYNIMYCGELMIGGKEVENQAKVSYIPDSTGVADNVIRNVRAKYTL